LVSSNDTEVGEVGAGEKFKKNEVAKWETIWRERWRGSCPSVESSRKAQCQDDLDEAHRDLAVGEVGGARATSAVVA
jgi:hypothetical protein